MRKIAFVDWDDTLSDIKKFTKMFLKFLDSFSCLFEPAEKSYHRAKTNNSYDPILHGRIVSDFYLTPEYVKNQIEKWFVSNQIELQNILYPDTKWFLRLLRGRGYEIHVLTLGVDWFQKAKIENSGLIQYISGVTVTQDPDKISAILNICDPVIDEVLLFDDFWTVINAMKVTFPKIYAVHVLRRDEYLDKRAVRADAFARNLGEAMGAVLSRPL